MTKIRFQRRILDPHPHIDCRKRIINIFSSLPTVSAHSRSEIGRKERKLLPLFEGRSKKNQIVPIGRIARGSITREE